MIKSNWTYTFLPRWSLDLTQETYGPMRLPVMENDYRPPYSPWFTLANLQLRAHFPRNLEIYAGVKNLLNFVPKDPIMRPEDPFNRQVEDPWHNPHGYRFDPGYNYASMQGRRVFLGLRWVAGSEEFISRRKWGHPLPAGARFPSRGSTPGSGGPGAHSR